MAERLLNDRCRLDTLVTIAVRPVLGRIATACLLPLTTNQMKGRVDGEAAALATPVGSSAHQMAFLSATVSRVATAADPIKITPIACRARSKFWL